MELMNYSGIVELIEDYGDEAAPRDLKTKEFLGFNVSFQAGLFVKRKKMNFDLAILEGLMMIGGIFDIGLISGLAPRCNVKLYEKQSDYGPRISDQLLSRVALLESDPFSRRAVLQFNTIEKLETDDIACTTSIQFLLRSGYLHSMITMRSSDLVLGFPMDIIMFSMLNQVVARHLNCLSGKIYLNVGSFHIYDSNKHLAVATTGRCFFRITDEWPTKIADMITFAADKARNYQTWIGLPDKSFLRIEDTSMAFEVH